MSKKSLGGIRLFQVFGITVYLHWTWFVAVLIALQLGQKVFHSSSWEWWSVGLYVLLFAIVLLHEFGHALACLSVGGRADRILLWPLGGLAFVQPPPRAGALLWSIAAGPLVNVALFILSLPLLFIIHNTHGDLRQFLDWAIAINAGLLLFNLIPVYPLDGGQIVRALLWFVVGRGASLAVSGWIGIVVAGLTVCGSFVFRDWWLALIAAFGALQSWGAIGQAKRLCAQSSAPRYAGLACPACQAAPPAGDFWQCECGRKFDTFQYNAQCPSCGHIHQLTSCLECGQRSPVAHWQAPLPLPPISPQPVA